MSEPVEPSLTVIFIDFVGSTSLYEKLGDDLAKKIVGSAIGFIGEFINDNEGRVIKTIGDEIMATFPSPQKAVEVACQVQTNLKTIILENDPKPYAVQFRMGAHHGPVIEEKGDVFGNTVNAASRLAAQSKARQILVSKELLDALDPEVPLNTRFIEKSLLKGMTEPLEIHEITPQEEVEGMTQAMAEWMTDEVAPKRLVLRFKGQEIILDENNPFLTLGRSPDNSLVIENTPVSRFHAQIELKKGNFVVVDKSINKTFIIEESGQKNVIHRNEVILEGKGILFLGKVEDAASPHAIHFEVSP